MGKVSETWPHELVKDAIKGCCGDDAWRGYLCPYHDGFADGVEAHEAWARNQDRRLALAIARLPGPRLEGDT